MSVKKNKTRKIKKLGGGNNGSYNSIQSMNSLQSIQSMNSLENDDIRHKGNQGNVYSQKKNGRASPSSVIVEFMNNEPQKQNEVRKFTLQPKKNRTLKIMHNSSNAIKDGVKFIQGEGNKYVQLYNGNVIPNGETRSLQEIKMMTKTHKFPVLIFDKSGQLVAHIDQSGKLIDVYEKIQNVGHKGSNPYTRRRKSDYIRPTVSSNNNKKELTRKNPFAEKSKKSNQSRNHSRGQSRRQSRSQSREQSRSQSKEQSRSQSRGQSRGKSRNQSRNKKPIKSRN
jgi:hypothetical protein